jgi:hypothetical protein
MNEILKYIETGITINGNPKDGYTVFTIPTQHFKISSLEELTPSKFEEIINLRKEQQKMEDELWRLSQINLYDEKYYKTI